MKDKMANCAGFEAVARHDARILILGSLPGVESLKQQQYYAHRQNSFWKIMAALVGAAPGLPYESRLERLMQHGIAVWDVCASAHRAGSLDANIQSPVANDLPTFFAAHQAITLLCFNGLAAEKLFRRHIAPDMPRRLSFLPGIALPSTSPAYAAMQLERKLLLWRAALERHMIIA